MSVAQCKNAVSPVLMQWSLSSLMLICKYVVPFVLPLNYENRIDILLCHVLILNANRHRLSSVFATCMVPVDFDSFILVLALVRILQLCQKYYVNISKVVKTFWARFYDFLLVLTFGQILQLCQNNFVNETSGKQEINWQQSYENTSG